MFRLTLALALIVHPLAFGQESDKTKGEVDLHGSGADLHLGSDADARKAGLPLYPGAQLKADDDNNSGRANLSLFTEAFGFKLVVAKYESNDAPDKVVAFYRDKLKRYGKVIECHSTKHGGDVDLHDDDKNSPKGNELKCDETSGPVTELKVGTEDDQHVVGIEPRDTGKGTTFSLVYVRSRAKRGEL